MMNGVYEQLTGNITEMLDQIKRDFGASNDLLIRELILADEKKTKVALVGIDGLINSELAHEFILHVLSIDLSTVHVSLPDEQSALYDTLLNSRISMMDANESDDVTVIYDNILNGHVALFVDGVAKAMLFDCKGWASRGVSAPTTEKSLWGPKDSFVETIRSNTAMLRRRLRDPRLRFNAHIVGERSKTDVFVAYIDGLTNPEFVQLTNERIKNIDIDGITSSFELIKLIEDKHLTLLPRLIETERPDRVMHALTQGQVAIFVDGSPFAILGPFHFTSAFSAIDDYYNDSVLATFKRVMRYIAYFSVVMIPGLYIALTSFHQEMIPTSLLITVINQRASNPFSTLVEIMIIVILFEILREASLRKPDAIGDSMTLVGSLIIGQMIVESGLVSYAAIIVGALTTISSFLLSSSRINTSARLFKVAFMFIGAWFGLYGLTLAFIVLITHLSSLTSMGQAYLAPVAPFNLSDQKDQILRVPLQWMKRRPKIFQTKDMTRMSGGESS